MPSTRSAPVRFLAVLGLLTVTAVSKPLAAQPVEPAVDFSTGELMEYCAGEGEAEERLMAFCEGFILGTGLLYLELRRADVIDAWACADPIPTLRQIRQDLVAWAQENPQHLDEGAVNGFWRAMAELYPCGGQ